MYKSLEEISVVGSQNSSVTSSTNPFPYSISHSLSRVFDYHKLSPSYRSFMCKISSNVEPTSFSENIVLVPEWKKAIDVELEA